MKKLPLKLLRDIKESKGQFIAIVLVIAVGAFFYTGLATLSNGVSTYTKKYFKDYNLSDLNVYYSQVSKEEITYLQKIEGVNKIEGRYTFDATQTFKEYKSYLKIHSIPAKNKINMPEIIEGSTPSTKNEILIDSRYAKEHNYNVGDKIEIGVNGKDLELTISGFCENVEHVFNIKDPKLVLPDHKTYGIAYISEAKIPEILGSFYYNELIIDAKDGYDINKLGQSIEAQSRGITYLYQQSKERTVSYSAIDTTIKNNKIMSTVSPLILFIVAAITIFLTMSRIIDSQRNQIGIMKALGVKNRSILLHYMGYPVLVGILGSIIGWLITAIAFVPVLNAGLVQTYSMPNCELSIAPYTIIPPIVISIVFGIISCYLSARTILSERAAQVMRPKPPKKMKKIFIESASGIWRRISYGNKIILRNIFLNKQKALASSIGVIVCGILLITAFSFESSMKYIANTINDVYAYDFKIDYKDTISSSNLKLPSGIKNNFSLATFPIELITTTEEKDASLIVTYKENNLINFFDEENNKILLNDNGVLVPKSYADKYNISEGDVIKLRFITPELKGQSVDMKVLKISTQYTNPAFYCTPAYLKGFGIDYTPNSLLVDVNDSSKLSDVRNFFEKDSYVDIISDKNDLKSSVDNIMKQNNSVFIIFILCAVTISFGAIFTISSINIYERTRELATLKVLGYPKNKINRLIFIENLVLTTFALIISLPASIYFYKLVVKSLSSTNQLIPNKLNISTIILSIIITFLLTIISNLLLRRKVSKIVMVESLKSIE